MGETNWLPALIALAIGVVGGVAFMFRSRAGRAQRAGGGLAAMNLELEDRIERLRVIADDPSAAAAVRRRGLEIEAARLLRTIETTPSESVAVPSTSDRDAGRPLRMLLWITGCSIAAAVIYFLMLSSLETRRQGAPATGDQSLAAAPASAREDALRARIAASPDDVAPRLALARMMLDQDRMMEVHELVQSVLERDPENALALAYESMVLLAIDRDEDAERLLHRALEIDPRLLEGWMHLGLVHFRQGDLEKALADLEQAKQISPADARMIDALAEEMRRAAGAAPAPAQTPAFAGTIHVRPEVVQRYRGATIFVILRAAGTDGGPPIAAQRLQLTGETLPFALGADDSMTGAPLPSKARIEVRIDEDGNAMTRGNEPSATTTADQGTIDLVLSL